MTTAMTILPLHDQGVASLRRAFVGENKAFLQGADFAEPVVFACFDQAFFCVPGHVLKAAGLGRIDLEEPRLVDAPDRVADVHGWA